MAAPMRVNQTSAIFSSSDEGGAAAAAAGGGATGSTGGGATSTGGGSAGASLIGGGVSATGGVSTTGGVTTTGAGSTTGGGMPADWRRSAVTSMRNSSSSRRARRADTNAAIGMTSEAPTHASTKKPTPTIAPTSPIRRRYYSTKPGASTAASRRGSRTFWSCIHSCAAVTSA